MQSIQTPETVSKSAASGSSEPVEAVSVVIRPLGRGIGNWPYRVPLHTECTPCLQTALADSFTLPSSSQAPQAMKRSAD